MDGYAVYCLSSIVFSVTLISVVRLISTSTLKFSLLLMEIITSRPTQTFPTQPNNFEIPRSPFLSIRNHFVQLLPIYTKQDGLAYQQISRSFIPMSTNVHSCTKQPPSTYIDILATSLLFFFFCQFTSSLTMMCQVVSTLYVCVCCPLFSTEPLQLHVAVEN